MKKKATKFFYTALMKQHITQTQNTINKWKRDLYIDEIDTKWETICSQICYIIPVKLRSFYFKFIHRALPYNHTLYKMKITQITLDFAIMSQRPLCICSGNVPMWKSCGKQFGTLFLYSQQKIIDTKMCNIILCTHNREKQIYTLISTIVKAYIFACNYAKKILDPVECWHKMECYQETKRLIYTKNNKLHKYTAKLHPFL